jgi:glycosyltransferase involved in cell wall biosynthesis
MRILFFAPAFTRFRGGIEAMIAILTNHLCQRGHEVGILTEGDAEQHPDPIFPIPSSVPIFQVWIHDTQEVRERLREIVRGFAPDVFVVRGASFVYFYMIDAVRGTNTRLILSESYDPEASAKHFPSSMARLTAFAGADRIHFLVDSFKDSLPPHLRERVRPISNPVEPNPRLARPEGAQGQRKTIINVARITFFQKAQDALVTAFAKLASKYPEWDLVLVGDTFKTHDHDALVKLVEERRLQNRVRILGSLPKPEVYAILAESHIFAFPSLFVGFGFARV